MLVRVWEKAKSDQNSSQRVTLPVAFLADWKKGVQLGGDWNSHDKKSAWMELLILEWTNKQLTGIWKEKIQDLTNGSEMWDRKED